MRRLDLCSVGRESPVQPRIESVGVPVDPVTELCRRRQDALFNPVLDGADGDTQHVGEVFLGQRFEVVGGGHVGLEKFGSKVYGTRFIRPRAAARRRINGHHSRVDRRGGRWQFGGKSRPLEAA